MIYKNIGKKRRDETRASIVEKATELFRKQGYYRSTIEGIVRKLHISKATFYTYWDEKQDLLFEIHQTAHKQLLEGLNKIITSVSQPDIRLRLAIINHINVACSAMSPTVEEIHQEHILKARYKRRIFNLRNKYDSILRGIIRDGMEQGYFTQVDPKLVGFVIAGAANYTQQWFSTKGSMSRDTMAQHIADILMKGILSDNRENLEVDTKTHD